MFHFIQIFTTAIACWFMYKTEKSSYCYIEQQLKT